MVNYPRFGPLCAHLSPPLSALTHKHKDYKPEEIHFKLFDQLKKEVSMMGALPYFDINAETTLQTNASKKAWEHAWSRMER